MDITKYLTNKDIQLSNDDINIEKLEKDIRKGYVLESEKDSAIKEALETNNKEYTNKYTELENKYTELEKSYNALEERNSNITNSNKDLQLQVEMTSQGFTKDKFEEVRQIRNSLYADEKDDAKAIELIKEKFGATYFPKTNQVDVPNEVSAEHINSGDTHKINITRKTSIKDLMR
jgi:hypothetical protein